eukprot:360508-Chlamydomonas_euryale.AAC.6
MNGCKQSNEPSSMPAACMYACMLGCTAMHGGTCILVKFACAAQGYMHGCMSAPDACVRGQTGRMHLRARMWGCMHGSMARPACALLRRQAHRDVHAHKDMHA